MITQSLMAGALALAVGAPAPAWTNTVEDAVGVPSTVQAVRMQPAGRVADVVRINLSNATDPVWVFSSLMPGVVQGEIVGTLGKRAKVAGNPGPLVRGVSLESDGESTVYVRVSMADGLRHNIAVRVAQLGPRRYQLVLRIQERPAA